VWDLIVVMLLWQRAQHQHPQPGRYLQPVLGKLQQQLLQCQLPACSSTSQEGPTTAYLLMQTMGSLLRVRLTLQQRQQQQQQQQQVQQQHRQVSAALILTAMG
jgi:hypothetical protein